MQSETQKLKTSAEHVAAILRDRIVKGDLAPRDRIIERHLSAELDVSRTPIREALKLLEADGLIDITLHRGALVAEFEAKDAAHVFDVIAVLEGLAAERLAEVMTPALLQKLEDLHGIMLEHYGAARHEAYFDVNTIIHETIVEGCENPVVIDTHRRLIARGRRGRFLAIMNPERLAEAVQEHEQLMRAFRANDTLAAGHIWRTHLRHTGETLADVLSQRNDMHLG